MWVMVGTHLTIMMTLLTVLLGSTIQKSFKQERKK